MKQKCEYCAKDLKESADVCLHCGKLVKKIEESKDIKTKINLNKKKIPGNGQSIAGMILGIVSSTWVFFELLSLGIVGFMLNEILIYNDYTSSAIIKISFAIGYTMFSLIPSFVGLPLSLVGYNKMKTGKNISGIVLNLIGLGITLLIYVYIMIFA